MYQQVQESSGRKKTNKFIAGIAAFAAAGIITASGLAGAAPMTQNSSSSLNEDDCKKAGFSSLVLCKEAFGNKKSQSSSTGGSNNSNNNDNGMAMGHGYGGGNTSVAVNLELNDSNDNIFNIIVNVFR